MLSGGGGGLTVEAVQHQPVDAGPGGRHADQHLVVGAAAAQHRGSAGYPRSSGSRAAAVTAVTDRSRAANCTARLTGPPRRASGEASREKTRVRKTTSPSASIDTTKDSSPLSGCPGRLP